MRDVAMLALLYVGDLRRTKLAGLKPEYPKRPDATMRKHQLVRAFFYDLL